MLDHFQMGRNLVRGFAPAGIGPRAPVAVPVHRHLWDALGGPYYPTTGVQAWSTGVPDAALLPAKDTGVRDAAFADAGSLWN